MIPAPAPFTLPDRAVDLVVMDVLQAELGLDAQHCLLGNQEYDIPNDSLFVVIFDDAGPAYGACDFLDEDATSPTFGLEVQQSTVQHTVRVAIMAFIRDDGYDEAKAKKEQVVHALGSIFSQQAMGQHRMSIGRPTQPVNASDAEGTRRLVRYDSAVKVTALHQTAKAPPGAGYYNKFNGATTDGTALPPPVTVQQ